MVERLRTGFVSFPEEFIGWHQPKNLKYLLKMQGEGLMYNFLLQTLKETYERDAAEHSCRAWNQVTMGFKKTVELII